MASVNKVILIGYLGKDPEIRYTPSGVAVANFSIATSEKWKDKQGEQQEKTEWHNIVAWKKLGEICGEYLSRGQQVYIEGRLQTRAWEDRDGNKKYTTEIVANQMKMLGKSSTAAKPANKQQALPGAPGSAPGINEDEIPEDEIPF